MKNLFGIGILLEIKDKASEKLRGVSQALSKTETQAERTARAFNNLDSNINVGSGNFQTASQRLSSLSGAFNNTSSHSRKFSRQMQQLSYILGEDVPMKTKLAYAEMFRLQQEIRSTSRRFGKFSAETMNARHNLTQWALDLDKTTFKHVFMRSQLGLNEHQLRIQADAIKLNAKMTKLMGNQTEHLIHRMKGLQKAGVKPDMLLPPSTLGQFQMMNETIGALQLPIYKFSTGYRKMGTAVEGFIKKFSAQKVAVRMAQGDMVKYGLILRGITTGLANVTLAFPLMGIAAFGAYKMMFKTALDTNEGLRNLADTVKGKVLKAFEPLIQVAGKFLEVALKVTGAVADWISAFNQAHPVAAKILGVIGFLAPAMTLLLLPLALGVGLWRGWALVLNSVWTLIGGVASAIGLASSTFLVFAGAIGGVIWVFTYLMQTSEGFRNVVNKVVSTIKNGAIQAFQTLKTTVLDVVNAFKDGGIEGGFRKINEVVTSFLTNFSQHATEFISKGVDMLTKFAQGISENLPQMREKGMQIIQNIIEGITINLPKIINLALILLRTWVESIVGNAQMLLEVGTQLLQTLLEGIVQALPYIVDAVIEIINTFMMFITENLPMIIDSGIQILNSLVLGIMENLPIIMNAVTQLLTAFGEFIIANLPMLINSALQILTTLANGIMMNLPMLIGCALQIMVTLITGIISNLPQILTCAIQIIGMLAQGIINNLPRIIACGIQIIGKLASTIIQNIPQIISAIGQVMTALAMGIIRAVPKVVKSMGDVVRKGIDKVKSAIPNFLKVGGDIITGLANGIKNGVGKVVGAIGGVVKSAISSAKKALGINSPSKLFKKFGAWTSEGFSIGITDEVPKVVHSVENMTDNATQTTKEAVARSNEDMFKIGKKPTSQPVPPTTNNTTHNYNITVNAQSNEDATALARKIYEEIKRMQQLDNSMSYDFDVAPVF